jgi:hypothetical protein
MKCYTTGYKLKHSYEVTFLYYLWGLTGSSSSYWLNLGITGHDVLTLRYTYVMQTLIRFQ